VPPGGKRSVRDLAEHLGAILVWDSQAFGDRSMHWDWRQWPESVRWLPQGACPEEAIAWVRDGVGRFRQSVAALPDDSELQKPRLTPQGTLQETGWIVTTMIEHLLYHSGEINHIRALYEQNDD
jgi:hypothetical protein